MIDIETLKKNPKTQYLASEYERLQKSEEEVTAMIADDPNMATIAADELSAIHMQKKTIETQIKDICRAHLRQLLPCLDRQQS